MAKFRVNLPHSRLYTGPSQTIAGGSGLETRNIRKITMARNPITAKKHIETRDAGEGNKLAKKGTRRSRLPMHQSQLLEDY